MCMSLALVDAYKAVDIWVLSCLKSTRILIMSKIPNRFTGHVAANIYSSKTGKVVKEYLEKEALKDWAEATKGVDGAESAEVVLVIGLDFIASVSC